MSLNPRQTDFVNKVKAMAKQINDLYGPVFNLVESFNEEFKTGQVNPIQTADLEGNFNFSYDEFAAAINQSMQAFLNLYTGVSVTTREYGRDLRKVA